MRDESAEDVRLVPEAEFKHIFPDCEPGAMPPFGNLYDLSVLVSPDLAEETEIAFNAGTHTEIIRMMFDVRKGTVQIRNSTICIDVVRMWKARK